MHLLFFLISLGITGDYFGLPDAEPVRAEVLQDAFPGKRSSILVTEVQDDRGRKGGSSYIIHFYPQDRYFLRGEILNKCESGWESSGEFVSREAFLRSRIYRSLKGRMKSVSSGSMLIDALLLGYPHKSVQDLFRSCGLSFLLALSGMHLSLIIQFCRPLFFPFPRRVRELLLVVFILIFFWICGFRHSLFRAVLMFLIRMFYLYEGEGKGNRSLMLLSVTIHLLLFPHAWSSLSFQLSYGAMFGIFLFSPFISLKLKWIKYSLLREILALSLGAQAMVSPWICWTLGQFHPFSLLSSLILVPLITLFLYLSLSFLCLSFIDPLIPCFARVLCFLEKNILKLGSIMAYAPHIELGKGDHKRLICTGALAIPAIIMLWLIYRRNFHYGKKLEFKLRFPFRNTYITGYDGPWSTKKMGTEFSDQSGGQEKDCLPA